MFPKVIFMVGLLWLLVPPTSPKTSTIREQIRLRIANYRENPVTMAEQNTGGWLYEINSTSWNGTGMLIRWKNVSSEELEIEVTVGHRGWAGFGFCLPRTQNNLTKGMMQNCDMALAFYDATGSPQVCDMWSKHNGHPDRDTRQDFKSATTSSNAPSGGMSIKFKRKLKTKDPADADLSRPVLLTWANHEQPDPIDYANCVVKQHGWERAQIFVEHSILMLDPLRKKAKSAAGGRHRCRNIILVYLIYTLIKLLPELL